MITEAPTIMTRMIPTAVTSSGLSSEARATLAATGATTATDAAIAPARFASLAFRHA